MTESVRQAEGLVSAQVEQREAVKSEPKRKGRNGGFWTRVLEHTDAFVYVLVGICFFIAALLSLGYGIARFGYSVYGLAGDPLKAIQPGSDAAKVVIDFVSDLLLTLIIMEVMGTVVHYLRTRETSLKPFLFIGIVSATRGILAVGARLSIGEEAATDPNSFRNSMIELAVNAAVIIALGVTMRLIGRFLEDRHAVKHHAAEPNER